jgi:hypothetical protein
MKDLQINSRHRGLTALSILASLCMTELTLTICMDRTPTVHPGSTTTACPCLHSCKCAEFVASHVVAKEDFVYGTQMTSDVM